MPKNGNNRQVSRRRPTPNPMAPTTVVKRTLHRMATFGMTAQNVNGGTEGYIHMDVCLNDFDAATQLVQQYEQYKITSMKVQVRPNLSNTSTRIQLQAMYGFIESGTMEFFIDYDSTSSPTQQETYRRDRLIMKRFSPGAWTTIAKFKPKVKFDRSDNSLPALVTGNEWLSTQFPDLNYNGLRGIFKQDSTFWGTTSTTCAQVSIYYSIEVEFRGLKSGT